MFSIHMKGFRMKAQLSRAIELLEQIAGLLREINCNCEAEPEPTTPLHPFRVGETYFSKCGQRLQCCGTNAGLRYRGVVQPIKMTGMNFGSVLHYTVEGWHGATEEQYPEHNIDMTRLPSR